jgi:hypothetical protein
MSDKDGKRGNITPSLSKFYEIELTKIFDAALSLQNLRVQVGGVFGSLSVVIFGIAMSSQRAGIFFIGGAHLLVFIYLDAVARSMLATYYYRGTQLLSQFAPHDRDAFLGLLITIHDDAAPRIRELIGLSDTQQRNRKLRRMGFRFPTFAGFWIPLAGATSEIAIGLTLWLVAGWAVF